MIYALTHSRRPRQKEVLTERPKHRARTAHTSWRGHTHYCVLRASRSSGEPYILWDDQGPAVREKKTPTRPTGRNVIYALAVLAYYGQAFLANLDTPLANRAGNQGLLPNYREQVFYEPSEPFKWALAVLRIKCCTQIAERAHCKLYEIDLNSWIKINEHLNHTKKQLCGAILKNISI